MCACTESDVRESATRLQSKRLINFTLGLKVRQCALLSGLLTHSAIGSYTSGPRQMLLRLHAPFPVSSTVERTVYEYLPYNNWTNTRLAQTSCVIPFAVWQQMILWGRHNSGFSTSLRKSKCIRMHHINPVLSEVVA
jgi:hypothetical protein